MTPRAPHVWNPQDHAWTAQSHVADWIRRLGVGGIDGLRRWSVEDTARFWDACVKECGIDWAWPYQSVRDDSRGFPWTRWFIEGRVNIAWNCIHRHVAAGAGNAPALIFEADSDAPDDRRQFTFLELSRRVHQCAAAMRQLGLGPGDAVGLYAPMRPEMVIVFFAAMQIGARVVPVFCGFGEEALRERLALSGARALFASEHLHRRGKAIASGDVARRAVAGLDALKDLVFIDRPSFMAALDRCSAPTPCADTRAEDACLIIYTSGTTGRPKGTVHTHAGCLAQMTKELRFAFDVRAGEPFFWMTDIGWMMGPWELIGALFHRAPVVLFDGAPDWPTPDRLWQILERHRVVTFGISPTAIRLLMRSESGKGPRAHDLSALRVLGSTGEPWDERSWHWFFEQVGGARCPVINISGGTELVGCLLMPHPVEPLKPCSLGGPALGMDVAVVDDTGAAVPVGAVGHLVCRQPAPSMTKSFLGDDARYLETYFSQIPGVWYHGDWASVDEDGGWFLHGRSDDTIKVAGKRLGPAEVEGLLIRHGGAAEAAAIGVPDELKGQALVVFAVARGDGSATAESLTGCLIEHLGKPLAPKAVHLVGALPKTRSGKIVRGAIRRAYLGEPLGDVSTVENPGALDAITALARR